MLGLLLGISITENMSIDAVDVLLSEWGLVNHIDGGADYLCS
jgi:hypothetical protein